MRAKKFLALLLSGMVLAGCLSGCNRTIIEHQFHTNTVTDTEYIETIVDSGLVSGVEKLVNLFTEHGIMVYFSVSPLGDADSMMESSEELNVSPSPEQAKVYYQDPNDQVKSPVIAMVECNDEHWMSAWSDAAELIYQAIIEVIQDGTWDWDVFKTRCEMVVIILNEVGDTETGQRQAIRTILTAQ